MTEKRPPGFNIPFFLTVGPSNDMLQGIETYGDMTAVTSSGVSAWGLHYKFPAYSEIVLIHMTFLNNQESLIING